MKCIICDVRPARQGAFCAQCNNHIGAMSKAKVKVKPRHFLTYRGHVVGLFPNGGKTLKAQLLKRSPKGLPKRRTLDLNIYCEGFTRETIKSFKACILQLTHA